MYCTISDILQEMNKQDLILLVNDENRSSYEIDFEDDTDLCSVRINEQISKADDEINSYLRSRYILPLSATPPTIKQISKDLTIYNLYKRRRREDMPQGIVDINNKTLKSLDKIQKGMMILDVEGQTQSNMAAEVVVNKTEADRIFNDDMLSKY